LRNRVNADQRPDSERVEALQRENKMLRQQLIDVQAKMSKVLASVQLLSDSVTKTLDDTKDGNNGPEEPDQEGNALGQKKYQHVSDSSLTSLDLDSFDPSLLDFDAPFVSANITGK
jgi:threonine aldolase